MACCVAQTRIQISSWPLLPLLLFVPSAATWDAAEVLKQRQQQRKESILQNLTGGGINRESLARNTRNLTATTTIWKLCAPAGSKTWQELSFLTKNKEFSLFVLAASLVNISATEAQSIRRGPLRGQLQPGVHVKAAVLVQVSAAYLENHPEYNADDLEHYSVLKQDLGVYASEVKGKAMCTYGTRKVKVKAVFVEQGGDAIYLFCPIKNEAVSSMSSARPFDLSLTLAPSLAVLTDPGHAQQRQLQLKFCAHTVAKRRTIWCSNALESMDCGFSSKLAQHLAYHRAIGIDHAIIYDRWGAEAGNSSAGSGTEIDRTATALRELTFSQSLKSPHKSSR